MIPPNIGIFDKLKSNRVDLFFFAVVVAFKIKNYSPLPIEVGLGIILPLEMWSWCLICIETFIDPFSSFISPIISFFITQTGLVLHYVASSLITTSFSLQPIHLRSHVSHLNTYLDEHIHNSFFNGDRFAACIVMKHGGYTCKEMVSGNKYIRSLIFTRIYLMITLTITFSIELSLRN